MPKHVLSCVVGSRPEELLAGFLGETRDRQHDIQGQVLGLEVGAVQNQMFAHLRRLIEGNEPALHRVFPHRLFPRPKQAGSQAERLGRTGRRGVGELGRVQKGWQAKGIRQGYSS